MAAHVKGQRDGLRTKTSTAEAQAISKMKRKTNADSKENVSEVIGAKKTKTSFSEIEFKFLLKDSTTALSGFQKFNEAVKEYPVESNTDIVALYCRSSPDAIEILEVLEAGKRKSSELNVIFTTIESILLRTADDLVKYKKAGREITQRLVADSIGKIHSLLDPSNTNAQMRTGLKLLISMVMQGSASAQDVLSNFTFSQHFVNKLINSRQSKVAADVRTCVIQFLMAFLVIGDSNVIRNLLQVFIDTKGFLKGIFGGLYADSSSVVQMVLSTLMEKVVKNPSITKTMKVRIFNDRVLQNLATLYHWKGEQGWKQRNRHQEQEEMEEDSENDIERGEIQELAHSFLLEICCSTKYGIAFHDKGVGTSGKNMNHILTKFLMSLSKPHKMQLKEELVTKILSSCPDQLHWYLPSLRHSIAPRLSPAWLACVQFFRKVYQMQTNITVALQGSEKLPPSKLVAMVIGMILPPKEIMSQIIQGMKKSLIIGHHCLRVILLSLDKASQLLTFCEERNQDFEGYINVGHDFVKLFKETLNRNLPDVRDVLNIWNRLVKQDETRPEEIEQDSEEEYGDVKMNYEGVSQCSQMSLILQVLCAYQVVLPEHLSHTSLNFSSLIAAVKKVEKDCIDDRAEQIHLLHLCVLKLLATSDVRQLSQIREASLGQKRSVWYHVLSLLFITAQPKLLHITRHLLVKLLLQTGLFEQVGELHIWLQQLSECCQENQESVLKLMEHMVVEVLNSPCRFLQEVQQMAARAAASEGTLLTDSAQIDLDVAMVADNIWRNKDDIAVDMPAEQTQLRLPFSTFVPASLSSLKAISKNQPEVLDFVDHVLMRVVSTQVDARPLCLMLAQHADSLKQTVVLQYIQHWLPKTSVTGANLNPKIEMGMKSSGVVYIHNLLWQHFEGAEDVSEKLMTEVEKLPVDDRTAVILQILLYIDTAIKMHSEKEEMLINELQFYFGLLKKILDKLMELGDTEEGCGGLTDDIQFEKLLVRRPARHVMVTETCQLILQHPRMLQMFFTDSDTQIGKMSFHQSHKTKFSSLFTKNICHYFDILTGNDAAQTLLAKYCQKIHESVKKCPISNETQSLAVGKLVSLIDRSSCLDILNSILMEDVQKMDLQGEDLMPSANSLTFIINDLLSRSVDSSVPLWNELHSVMSKLTVLILSTSVHKLEESFLNILQQQPLFAVTATRDLLWKFLESQNDTSRQIVNILLQQSAAAVTWFEDWCSQTVALSDLHISVITTYLLKVKSGNSGIENNLAVMIKGTLLPQLSVEVIKSDVEISEEKFTLLQKFVERCSGKEKADLRKQLSQICSGTNKVTVQQIKLYNQLCPVCITASNQSNAEDLSEPQFDIQLVLDFMNTFSTLTASKKAQNKTLENLLLHSLFTRCQLLGQEDVYPLKGIWSSFLKSLLRTSFKNSEALKLISKLSQLLLTQENDESALPVHNVYNMILNHSKFLHVMFEESSDLELKDALLDLMLTLVRMDSSCCQKTHISVLLGAYSATLTQTDQKLLLLLKEYENCDAEMSEYRPYLWGSSSVEYYAGKKKLGASLRKEPGLEQVMEQLDAEKLYKSALCFPVTRKLQTDHVIDPADLMSDSACYDPSFLLAVFSDLLGPGSLVNCRRFIEKNCLGFTLAALSCHDIHLRGAAYHVLAQFSHHIEGAKFFEQDQFVYLLECLKNSIDQPNKKLACIITVFLVKVTKLLLEPENHMYPLVNSFLLLKPGMDVTNIPEFYKLFNSSSQEYKLERSWMLLLMEDGLRETADYRIFEKRYAFKLLLSFCNSATSDPTTQNQVLKILEAACKYRTVALDLCRNHAMLTWLNAAAASSRGDTEKLQMLTRIISALWFVLLGKQKKHSTDYLTGEEKEQSIHCLPLMFSREVMLTVLSLLSFMNNKTELATFNLILKMAASVLHHLERSGECGVCPVSRETVLLLLRFWSRLTPDLLSSNINIKADIQMVTRKFPIREAAVERDSAEKGRHRLNLHETSAGKMSDDTGECSTTCSQNECSLLLSNILLKWNPHSELSAQNENMDGDLQLVVLVMGLILVNVIKSEKCKLDESSDEWQESGQKKPQIAELDTLTCLRWILKTVSHKSFMSSSLRQLLLSNDQQAQTLIGHLLTLLCTDTNHMDRQTHASEMRMRIINDIFIALIEEATRLTDADVRISRLLSQQNYSNMVQKMRTNRSDHTQKLDMKIEKCFSLAIQELWIGSDRPVHADVCFTTRPVCEDEDRSKSMRINTSKVKKL